LQEAQFHISTSKEWKWQECHFYFILGFLLIAEELKQKER
jgi:hypothetical protein